MEKRMLYQIIKKVLSFTKNVEVKIKKLNFMIMDIMNYNMILNLQKLKKLLQIGVYNGYQMQILLVLIMKII